MTTTLGPRYAQALTLAHELHREQRRKGSEVPYISHLLSVSALALEHGADEDEAIAALLHDAAEDQGGEAILRQLEQTFGQRVATLVEALSDTVVTPKPPWRERKEAYIAHLQTAPPSVLLVSSCDKLHNATTIYHDYLLVGPELWTRFTGRRDGTLWYYRSLATTLETTVAPRPLVDRLQDTVDRLHRAVNSKEPDFTTAS